MTLPASATHTELAANSSLAATIWKSLLAVTVVAFGLRLVAIHFLYHVTWNDFSDHLLFGFETGRIASSLASGHGFGNPLFVETGSTAWTTPVYPYLLAAIFNLFGIYTKTSAFAILSLNALFSALVCIPLFFISCRIFGRKIALLSTWIWAVFPYAISITAFVWDTCLSALLLTTLFLVSFRMRDKPVRGWTYLALGAAWGFAVLTNASILSLFPFLVGWALAPLWQKRRTWLLSSALAVLGLFATLLPWQVRNYQAFHHLIPLRDTFWLELWVGNDGYSQTEADLRAHPSFNPAERDDFVRLGEIPYMQLKRKQALTVIAHHPRYFLSQCVRRIVYTGTGFWNLAPVNLQDQWKSPSSIFLVTLTTMLMFAGLWQTLRAAREFSLPFLFVLGIYPLVFYVTHPAMRYRHVIDPEVVILAAVGVTFLFSRIRGLLRFGQTPSSA
jgi:4-amino-4-deoxy-L-arabinose transferase-like glycosyltransferase